MGERVDDNLRNAVMQKFAIQSPVEDVSESSKNALSVDKPNISNEELANSPLLEVLKNRDNLLSSKDVVSKKRKKLTETINMELIDGILESIF